MKNIETVEKVVANISEAFGKAARESMFWRGGLYSAVRNNDEAKFIEVQALFADDLTELMDNIFWTNPKFKAEAKASIGALRAL